MVRPPPGQLLTAPGGAEDGRMDGDPVVASGLTAPGGGTGVTRVMGRGRPVLALALGLFGLLAWGVPVRSAEPGAAAPAEAAPAGPEGGAAKGTAAAPELLLWQEIPTVVSASRREEPASQAPNAVSIITAEDIHASGIMALGDLLRLAVGVDMAQIDNANYAVGVRGLVGRWENSTLVLIDGRTICNPVWGSVLWASQPILVEDIERIEVVRGPGGAAWGANAVNGVINIITKKPGDTPGFFLSQTLTNRLDSLTEMRYGLTAGPLDLRLSAGYDSLPEIRMPDGPDNHDFVRMPRVNLRSTYHFDKQNSLDVDAGYVDGVWGNVDNSTGFFAAARWFPQSHFLRTRFTHQEAPDDLWYVQYYMNGEVLTESEGGWIRYTQHDVEVQRVQRAGDRHVLTYGGNLRLDYMDNGDPTYSVGGGARFDNRETRNVQAGLFIQDHIQLNDQWSVVAGVRGDRNSYTGWEWAGRGTLIYHPVAEHTFRLSAARAFRTPTLMDRAFDTRVMPLPFPLPPFGLLFQGNPDIESPCVQAYEFGYAYEKKNLRLGADFFLNDYRGIIAPVLRSAPGVLPIVQMLDNSIDGDLYGVELSGRWQATRRLRLDASYVWEQWVQDGTRSATNPALETTGRLSPPQQKIGLGARYEPAAGLFLNGRMWWVDASGTADGAPVPPYARFDFTVSKELGKHCEVSVGVLNAFDPRHLEGGETSQRIVESGERMWFVRFQANF